MPLFIALPATFPVVKATIVGIGSIALGAVALFFGKRRPASESPKSSPRENSQIPLASALIAEAWDKVQQVSTRVIQIVRETVETAEESIHVSAEAFKKFFVNARERLTTVIRKITEAFLADKMGLVLLRSALQIPYVHGLLKACLKSPPRTRAPSFVS